MPNLVLPKVRLFVPCLNLALEPGGARTIFNPLHTVRMPLGVSKFYRLDELWFYSQLTDGVGKFYLCVELHNEDGIIVGRSAQQEYNFKGGGQLNVKELKIQMRAVPFAYPGMYDFKLVATHAELEERGTATLRVLAG